MNYTYDALIKKLDSFTRKYYQNLMIRGAIYFVAIGLAAFLASVLLEYFGQFSTGVRRTLFFTLLLVFAILFGKYIAYPALKLLRLGEIISHDEASRMIGRHFPEVEDKLLNTLQLKRQADTNGGDSSLLVASINQRIEALEPVPFSSAVNFKDNRRYLKYVLPPLILTALLLAIAPSVLREGTQRLVAYNEEYIPVAPFSFEIENEKLETALNSNFVLRVKADGTYVPNEMRISIDGKLFRLKSEGGGHFSHTFRNVRSEVPFKLTAEGFYSNAHLLKVLPTPSIVDFDVKLEYPAYLKKTAETLSNTGNIKVPEGTNLSWLFRTENADHFYLAFTDTTLRLMPTQQSSFDYQRRARNAERYRMAATNDLVGGVDTLSYRIDVIKDAFPKIKVEAKADSTDERRVYFGGTISDDYGITELAFHYRVVRADGASEDFRESVRINSQMAQEFFHFADFEKLEPKPGDRIEYYFEVWDNDGVNGRKSTRSDKKLYATPNKDEIKSARKETAEQIKAELEKSIQEAREMKKEIEELNKDLLQNKEMGWQEKKRLEDLLKKQKKMQQQVEQIQKKNKGKLQQQERYMEQSESIMEKQRMLEKLFDELMSDEMKEMYRKLEEMMEKMDQNQIREELEKMEMSQEELEKELDRSLELFKQMEVEAEFEQAMDKLEELAKKQEELANESLDKNADKEALKEKQDALNEEFDELKEDLKQLEEKNQELENPNDIPNTEEQQQEIDEAMDKSSEELGKDKPKKASESQQKAADKMQEMADQMKAAMEAGAQEQAGEDMDALRALLENIIQLSFDQEDIMEELRGLNREDPRYTEMGRSQKKLQDDAKMVEDSLFALSKRVVQIQNIVNEEIGIINRNIEKSLEEIAERSTASANMRQQYAMTSFNNLALLLDEALQQMQKDMANQMPGTGNCQNPGGAGKTPAKGKMSKMQEEMGKKLEKMQKAMEKGEQPGGNKPGMGNQGMSKEVAKMAAEQAALRREVEKMAQELNQRGKGEGKGLEDIAEKMEKTEKDLVNMEITPETIRRQEEILTRLLESEKASREREYEEKRESEQPRAYEISNPEKYLEYNRRKAKEIEMLRTVPPDMKPYYKERVNEYFLNFETSQ